MNKKAKGRPRDDKNPERYQVRHTTKARAAWEIAANTSGMTLQDWIRATLDAEAATAHHVPMVKRKSS